MTIQKIGIGLIILGVLMLLVGGSLFSYQGERLTPIISDYRNDFLHVLVAYINNWNNLSFEKGTAKTKLKNMSDILRYRSTTVANTSSCCTTLWILFEFKFWTPRPMVDNFVDGLTFRFAPFSSPPGPPCHMSWPLVSIQNHIRSTTYGNNL